MTAATRPQPLTLATPCARPGCGHPYNWHVPGPSCAAGPDSAPCPCTAFQTPADTTEERPVSTPPVTAFDETAALFALMEGDREKARRIVADMLPGERAEFAQRLSELREILDDVGAPRCAHCGERIAKVPADKLIRSAPDAVHWWHTGTGKGECEQGVTVATPAAADLPQEREGMTAAEYEDR
ncbi:hypothetical protein ACPCSE_29360 [Streptomyces cellulosae]